jgi:hypothetical protein
MRLMGTAKLKGLVQSEGKGLSGVVSALISELSEASWSSSVDLLAQFPLATCNNNAVTIPIGEAHCVEFLIKYDIGMIFITNARTLAIRRETGPTAGRQAA